MNLIIFVTFVILSFIYVFRKYRNMKRAEKLMPPLVPGRLFFGNYFDIDPTRIHISITDIGKNYGDLFSLKIFGQNIVVLNSAKAIHEALGSRTLEFAGRPQAFLLMFATNNFQDLAFANPDQAWNQGRSMFHKFFSTMKRLHDRRYFSEILFFDQWCSLYKRLEKRSLERVSFDLRPILYHSQMKIICTMLFGQDIVRNSKLMNNIKLLDEYSKIVISHVYEASLNMQPLSFIFGNEALAHLIRALFIQKDTMKALFEEESNLDRLYSTESFTSTQSICVKSILDVMKNLLKSNNNTLFNPIQVTNMLTELLFAGMDTILNANYAVFLYLSKYQEVQEKCYKEICSIYGDTASLRHKYKLPYTNACIYETLRLISHIPLGVFRRTLIDVDCLGYKIPEDTIIVPNLWKMHHDESVYKDPYKFRPERFLDSKGQLVDSNNVLIKNLMPFGAGKRMCPGLNIANNIIFLTLTNIILNFEVKLNGNINDDPRSFKLKSNLTPNPYEVSLIKRDDKNKRTLLNYLDIRSVRESKPEIEKHERIYDNQRKTSERKNSSEIRAFCTDRLSLVHTIIYSNDTNTDIAESDNPKFD